MLPLKNILDRNWNRIYQFSFINKAKALNNHGGFKLKEQDQLFFAFLNVYISIMPTIVNEKNHVFVLVLN